MERWRERGRGRERYICTWREKKGGRDHTSTVYVVVLHDNVPEGVFLVRPSLERETKI